MDRIVLNTANRKTDESFLDLQTNIGTAVHTTLGKEQLISCRRSTITNTITFL